MTTKVAEIKALLTRENLAVQISDLWDNHKRNRLSWENDKKELRNYIFATDTTTTTNSKLPWKNKTTLPKLCQIRDNLHANYSSALFPNDNWLKWEGHTEEAETQEKRKHIEAYIANKTRESNYRTEIEKLLYDYIDFGNAFYDVVWHKESAVDWETGEEIPGYTGPKLVRISPLDIVFNPLATSFEDSYNVTRYIKTLGELKHELDTRPELSFNAEIVEECVKRRRALSGYATADINKTNAYQVDGFGSLADYYQSNYVEILEFEGSMHGSDGTYFKNVIITVVDRSLVISQRPMPSWFGKTTKGHVGWRMRPDNAYAMGPLDNLVGMQYRIDHLENLKADAMDLAVHPPLAITGSVEEFTWGPGTEIYMQEGGQIVELGKNLSGVMAANNEIATLELKMEELAGAPKNAMGIRTPGEKTAYEVQTLEMAASRIFQNKITHFEINLVEPSLNKMLELSRRNMDGQDLVRVMDDDLGVMDFLKVSKADITAAGKLRPVGARHFAAQATMMQNMSAFFSSPVAQFPGVMAHLSGKAIARAAEELLGLERFSLFGDNIALMESAETARIQETIGQTLEVEAQTPIEEEEPRE